MQILNNLGRAADFVQAAVDPQFARQRRELDDSAQKMKYIAIASVAVAIFFAFVAAVALATGFVALALLEIGFCLVLSWNAYNAYQFSENAKNLSLTYLVFRGAIQGDTREAVLDELCKNTFAFRCLLECRVANNL